MAEFRVCLRPMSRSGNQALDETEQGLRGMKWTVNDIKEYSLEAT